jgi:hypothetical protein
MTDFIADFDVDFNTSKGSESEYYAVLREFPNGAFEMVTRLVRPMQQDAARMRYEQGGAGLRVRKPDQEPSDFERQSNHKRAERRARQRIRWLCKSLAVDRLFTLTYRENMMDRDRLKGDFQEFLRLLRRNPAFKDFQYVCVPEVQKRGAYHLHLAVNGYYPVLPMLVAWQKALGGTGKERGEDTLGAVNVTSQTRYWGSQSDTWKTNRLAAYICKYLSETFDEHCQEKRRYWQSQGIELPVPQRIWLASSSATEMIEDSVSLIQTLTGVGLNYDMWISSDNTCFWCAG